MEGESIVELIKTRHLLIKVLREFFYKNGYIEVETPNLTTTCAPDPYIDPLGVYVGSKGPFYLHTSPEMGMKKLLKYDLRRIFQICKVYRVEDIDTTHSIEFTMLEWYREGSYKDLIDEVGEMIRYIAEKLNIGRDRLINRDFKIHELEGLFTEITGINPFVLNRSQLIKTVRQKDIVKLDRKDTWNDIFFKIFIQEIEPIIKEDSPYFVIDWPASISSMARPKEKNKVERFEMYIDGIEIANGYTELMDAKALKKRFKRENLIRKRLGKDTFLEDEAFFEAIDSVKYECSGVSVGIDRLLMALTGKNKIDDVLPFRLRT
ncbi:MAG: EF-P lysine aminoacylase EpmA [Syntrophorhabdaceae bacterium]|nr:EF-P lysine aminoacylase EpmA [Syntrophorhabdaceae bacterium]